MNWVKSEIYNSTKVVEKKLWDPSLQVLCYIPNECEKLSIMPFHFINSNNICIPDAY